jgi:hypothetical protein
MLPLHAAPLLHDGHATVEKLEVAVLEVVLAAGPPTVLPLYVQPGAPRQRPGHPAHHVHLQPHSQQATGVLQAFQTEWWLADGPGRA